jgi:RimJ/RimL family protein N-acetyltransferase
MTMIDPAVYPFELVGSIVLPTHRLVRVRPLCPREDAPVRNLYGRLSPRTRYQRFLSPLPALPDSVLSILTCVDYRRRLTLLAELDTPAGVEPVALGSFAAIDEGSVEVGLVVGDDWQRQGIGVALAARIMAAAQARGFDRFVAHALWENRAIRRIIDHVGDIVSSRTRHGVCELTFSARGGRGFALG